MHQYEIQASLKDYERATGVVESKGSMDYFVTQGKFGKEKVFKFLYASNLREGTRKEILEMCN